MIVKKTRQTGEVFYVNAFTQKEVTFKRVASSNPSNTRLEAFTRQKTGFYPRMKTKREKLNDQYSVLKRKCLKSFATLGEKNFNKPQFIIDCKRVNINPYRYLMD